MKVNYLFLFLLFGLIACSVNQDDRPDISEIKPNFSSFRMDQKLMQIDTSDFENEINLLIKEHPEFMQLYINNIMNFGTLENNDYSENVQAFVKEPRIRMLYDDIQREFEDFEDIERDFKKAFAYYKYYFPDRSIPNIYPFFSEYGLQRFVFLDAQGNDALGIGLDLFLGSDHPYREYMPDNPAFSSYLVRRYNKEHLVKRCMEALVLDAMPNSKDNRMLGQMIQNGKKIYILGKILPDTPDSILMEYTDEQLEWCEDNEIEMWAYFLKEDLFYQTDINKINKLVNPSPNSPGMPEMAPGRTGNYIGWKIVEAFMRRNPDYQIKDLLEMEDVQELLNRSRYKPRK